VPGLLRHAESDVVIEAEIDDEPDARNLPVQDFGGTVSRIESLTPTIKGVWIELDEPDLDFQAGQYVNLQHARRRASRAFSLAKRPGQPARDRAQHPHRARRAGTTWMHEHLKVGDRLKLAGPYGRFFVRKSPDLPLTCSWPAARACRARAR
jgi:phenol hydroxylase P5 protein